MRKPLSGNRRGRHSDATHDRAMNDPTDSEVTAALEALAHRRRDRRAVAEKVSAKMADLTEQLSEVAVDAIPVYILMVRGRNEGIFANKEEADQASHAVDRPRRQVEVVEHFLYLNIAAWADDQHAKGGVGLIPPSYFRAFRQRPESESQNPQPGGAA